MLSASTPPKTRRSHCKRTVTPSVKATGNTCRSREHVLTGGLRFSCSGTSVSWVAPTQTIHTSSLWIMKLLYSAYICGINLNGDSPVILQEQSSVPRASVYVKLSITSRRGCLKVDKKASSDCVAVKRVLAKRDQSLWMFCRKLLKIWRKAIKGFLDT